MNNEERDQILKLTEQVGELNGKVKQMDKHITGNLSSLEKRVVLMHNSVKTSVKGLENRMNKNEDNIAQMKGKAAGIALAISIIVSVVAAALAFAKGLF